MIDGKEYNYDIDETKFLGKGMNGKVHPGSIEFQNKKESVVIK
jgi:hypothetical protein